MTTPTPDNAASATPVAWAMTDYQADGANTQYTRDSHAAEYWGAQGIQIDPLFDAATVAALKAEVERLRVVESAARIYFDGYCQDEASDEVDANGRGRWTGCPAYQIRDAAALRDALTGARAKLTRSRFRER